jgi:acyl transferase domain-containing protein/NAD(P)-dependent dehydrogenase (short-subunit alcohol dehydrogenase family)
VAVIGMAAVFPAARSIAQFWSNTLRGVDAITEVPPDRWDWRLYYDPDPTAPDKIVSKWGGFLPDVPFDPLRYGIPPASLPSIEPAQLLALEVVRAAFADAGYADRSFPHERTAVVLGMGGGAAQLAMGYAFRSYLPMLDTVITGGGREALASCHGLLPEWTEDSFPGFLLNVTAGRIANRLNLGGANYTVDAACGSSLAAARLAVRELESKAADLVVLGGVDTVQNPFTYLAFSKTQAFSPRGRCRPFDAGANGIVISEGVAALVLKRLADAERDDDRIYAVIKGVGASSDGRARGLTAPVVEGQVRALERAYSQAGIDPATVGYVEAHGTGTALGDAVEMEALRQVFQAAGAPPHDCVVGSVKSLIGHTKCAAGLAGLINASLALYHKVLPPTIGIETVNPRLELRDGPFRLCTQPQPWLHPHDERPRRAGVSAFGFGGTNFHAVIEAYDRNTGPEPESALPEWPVELFVWEADDAGRLIEPIDRLARALRCGARPALRDLSHTLIHARASRPAGKRGATLVMLATSHEDLIEKLGLARAAIAEERATVDDSQGIVFAAAPAWSGAQSAFLFPGQGSQSPGMLRELAVVFPEVRDAFDEFDRVGLAHAGRALGPVIFPPPALDAKDRDNAQRALAQTDVAQPAIGAACTGMLRLLRSLGCEPSFLAGHSFGELVALHAAGVMTAADLAEMSVARGRLMNEASRGTDGAMAAVLAGPDVVEQLIRDVKGVQAANWNGPSQTVIAGPRAAVSLVLERANSQRIAGRLLPVSSAFHTSLVASVRAPLERAALERLRLPPERPVYSNLDAATHPLDPSAIATRLGEHLASPVRFAAMIEAMYRDGARVFVEVGPGVVLSSLVESILRGRPHLAISCDAPAAPGLPALLRAVARLVTAGLPLQLERLTAGRARHLLDLDQLPLHDFDAPVTPSTWLLNGSRARPINEAEPARFGVVTAPRRAGPAPPRDLNRSTTHDHHTSPLSLEARERTGEPFVVDRNGETRGAPPVVAPTTLPPAAVSPSTRSDLVIDSFQKTMRVFLEVQKSTMLAYLAGRSSPSRAGGGLPEGHGPLNKMLEAIATAGDAVPQDGTATSSPAVGHAEMPPGLVGTSGKVNHALPPSGSNGPGLMISSPRVESGVVASRGSAAVVSDADSHAPAKNPDRTSITARLLEIVRDRTGYPIETLGLELDIEADLGIDSIKRVEILGKLRDEFPDLKGAADSPDAMEALARARTLAAIIDRMADLAEPERVLDDRKLAVNPGGDPPELAAHPHVSILTGAGELGSNGKPRPKTLRRLLAAVDAPLPRGRQGLMPGAQIIITEDGRGVAEQLADRLRAQGFATARLGGPDWRVDWTSPAAVESALDRVRSLGPIAGMVHALPLGQSTSGEPGLPDWPGRIGDAVKGLFLLAKAAASDLEAAAHRGGACLIAATSLGGRFASTESSTADFFPGHGGVAGLVKTLAREWPHARCRVVDVAPGEPVGILADRLAVEVFAEDGWTEVGYHHGRRIRLCAVDSPLPAAGALPADAITLERGEPVVISGGARGITALVADELARAWQPTLLIIGTTPPSCAVERDDTAALAGELEIKSALHLRLSREGRPATAIEIESMYQALRRYREVRHNLAMLTEAGATVEYGRADVRDPQSVGALLDAWRRRYGNPVGLIHGAGLIKDKLIHEKTLDSFDRVLGTKLEGALNLLRLLPPDSLRFTVMFSSIAGRFGNVGQSDYAAANEILNKLALWLDARRPGRIVSVLWGPWSGTGMVSQLEQHLGRRGLEMIAPEVGRTLLAGELRHGRKGDVEVIYSGGLGTLDHPFGRRLVSPVPEAIR